MKPNACAIRASRCKSLICSCFDVVAFELFAFIVNNFHFVIISFLIFLIFHFLTIQFNACVLYVLLSVAQKCKNQKRKQKNPHKTPRNPKPDISRSPTSTLWQEDEIAPGPGNASTVSYSKQSYLDAIDTRSLSIDPMENMKPSPNHPFLYGDQTESVMDDPNKTLTAADSPKMHDHMTSGGGGSKEALQSDYDVDGNTETETKSVSSIKSNGSNQELRYFHFIFVFRL